MRSLTHHLPLIKRKPKGAKKAVDWKLLPLKRGRFNIESDLINNLDFFKTQTLSEKFPDSDCVYIYSNQNFIQYIFENEKYKNKLKELELTPENCFSKLINNLLRDFKPQFLN